jgi:cytochrome c-type biogenesis protein CcmF
LSRETFLLLNNVLLVIAAALVFIGTLSPLVYEVLGLGKISVGPPLFVFAFLIPMIPLVLLIGLGMQTAWRTQASAPWLNRLRVPAAVAIALGLLIPGWIYGRFGVLVCVGTIAAVWIMVVSLLQPLRFLRRASASTRMTRSVLGMSVAHFGVGLFVLGVTIVSAFGIEMDRALRPGQWLDIGAYRFEMRELRDVEGPNFSAREGVVEIRRNGEFIGEVRPQKRQYLVQKNWMTEAGILAAWNRDLFIALGDQIGNDVWSVRVQYKPMIRFIWLGALVMALGGLIAATDRRYRVRVRAESRVGDTATEST